MQKDPAGYVDGLNLYAYVLNNPLMYLDPMGLTAVDQRLTDALLNYTPSYEPDYNNNLVWNVEKGYTWGEPQAVSTSTSYKTKIPDVDYSINTSSSNQSRSPSLDLDVLIERESNNRLNGGSSFTGSGYPVADSGQTASDAGNGYNYTPQNHSANMEVRVYSSDAFGVKGVNHAFVYSQESGRGKGTAGSSWITKQDGVGNLSSPYNVVSLPPGMSESDFMDKIENADGWNNWIWIPYLNDCHSDLENAFDQAGVSYPGAPNGRIDFDDEIKNSFNQTIYQLSNPQNLKRLFGGY
ncbi:MAG: hypothetical protein KKD66_12150 [Proteobacteria bacterium]|nr:hypothetical protein [Pseudomonadota bacterium]MBU2453482.1 hypothetical protein [Pseudomonadota bacterium]